MKKEEEITVSLQQATPTHLFLLLLLLVWMQPLVAEVHGGLCPATCDLPQNHQQKTAVSSHALMHQASCSYLN